jgi:copper chaperone
MGQWVYSPDASLFFEGPQVKIEFQVKGMSCQHCVSAVTHAIHEHDASAQVQVDLTTGNVAVESEQSAGVLQSAIDEAGYTVVGDSGLVLSRHKNFLGRHLPESREVSSFV